MLPGKQLSAAELLQMARRRVWVVMVPTVVVLFGALVYSASVPDLYQSNMLVAIDPQRVPDSFVRSTVTLDADRRMDAISVQVLSRTNLEQMIDAFNLYPDQRATAPIGDLVDRMRNDITVKMEFPRPRWGAPLSPTSFHVMFTYSDPETAALVTQRLGSLFVDSNSRDRAQLAGATNEFLEARLAESRTKLVEQEQLLEAFRQKHGPALPTQIQSNLQAMQAMQLQAQSLVESIARDRDRQLVLERLRRDVASTPPVGPVAANPERSGTTASSAAQQLAAAKSTLQALELKYTADHPDVVRAHRLVEELVPKAAAEAVAAAREPAPTSVAAMDPAQRDSVRQMATELESLARQIAFKESEEARVRREVAEYQRRVEAVPGLESEFSALTRDYDTQQAAYKELLTKSNAAEVSEELERQEIGERFRIVDAAQVPVSPLPSMRGRYNASGLALGLLLGLGLATLLELRDASFRNAGEVLLVLGLPVLASVPHVPTSAERVRHQRKVVALSAAGVVSLALMSYVSWTLKIWNSIL